MCQGRMDKVSRAEHHFRDLFLLLQEARRDHQCLLFPPSILALLGFHRLQNQVLALLAQIVPPSSPAI